MKDIVDEIVRLRTKGDIQEIIPLPMNQIAKKIGMSRQQTIRYRDLAIKVGKLAVDENRKEIIPDQIKKWQEFRILRKDEFTKKPLVKEWITDLLTRKQGKPIKTWKKDVVTLRKLCNTCQINPEQLIIDKQTTEKIVKNYAELCMFNNTFKKVQKIQGNSNTIHVAVMVVRNFCAYYNITWPRGTSGIMSGKVVGHGKYADIRMTSNELDRADKFIKKKWGIDSDIYRIFWIGIESCARKTTLLEMKCEWTKHINKKTGKTIFSMIAFESKTDHIKNGKWAKYITRKDTQHSLNIHKRNEFSWIWNHLGSRWSAENKMRKQLREIFKHVGKIDDYYYTNPFHSLRHVGAHYWLEKSNYNYGFVAKVGGWHTIDELKKSYGEMPPEFIIDMLETKLVHNMFS